MFPGTDEDDSFNPSAGSNLASLFGISMTLPKTTEPNLSYTAPKQPKNLEKISKPQSSIVCTKFVDVFKLINNEQVNQGKCGIALIGSETINAYEIILYKSKQDIVARSKLKSGFILYKQINNFACFCDDLQQQWSVHFEELKDMDDFFKCVKFHNGQISQFTEPKLLLKIKDEDNDSLSDNSTTRTKASILSRMAKMGQPILPKTSLSESETSECDQKITIRKNKKKQFKDKFYKTEDRTLNLSIPQNEFMFINENPATISTFQLQHDQPLWNRPQTVSDPLNIFIAENRTHNCEMRMNMSQLSYKLDAVLEKVTVEKSISASTPDINQLKLKVVKLEMNLKELQTENASLSNDLKIANERVQHITQENELYKITINECEQTVQEIQNVKKENLEKQEVINNLQRALSEQNSNVEKLTKFYKDHENDDNLKIIEKLNEENNKLKLKLEEKSNKQNLFSRKLKQNMNQLYQMMMESFSDEDVKFGAIEIKAILSKNLKSTTFNIIEEFNKDLKYNDDKEIKSICSLSI
ncbi:hypothetical protein FQA39_LY15053 [Lamprigera yunnana]|nr:hypothetical protein FQA39_LY15053 [Lamprigera yunnana]